VDFHSSTCAPFLDTVAAEFIPSFFLFDHLKIFKDFFCHYIRLLFRYGILWYYIYIYIYIYIYDMRFVIVVTISPILFYYH